MPYHVIPIRSWCIQQRAQDTVFVAEGGRVNVCNFQGSVRHSIPFTNKEGEPCAIDLNGDFLAVATTNGVIKVLKVSKREPTQLWSAQFDPPTLAEGLGPEGSLVSSSSSSSSSSSTSVEAAGESDGDGRKGTKRSGSAAGRIRSIRCNCDGTQVSILSYLPEIDARVLALGGADGACMRRFGGGGGGGDFAQHCSFCLSGRREGRREITEELN